MEIHFFVNHLVNERKLVMSLRRLLSPTLHLGILLGFLRIRFRNEIYWRRVQPLRLRRLDVVPEPKAEERAEEVRLAAGVYN